MRILLKFYIIISDSYDASQIRISGQFSYEKSSQRELQFLLEIRELPLQNRIWKEDESKFTATLIDFFLVVISGNHSLYGVEIILSRPLHLTNSIWL